VCSDSTLFRCWETRDKIEKKPDLEVHNGATIKDLAKIIKSHYINTKDPIKIILFGGLNDLAQNKEPAEILEKIADLKAEVKNANKNSVVMVATVPLVPKFCSLNVSQQKKGSFYDLPKQYNKINEFEALNAGIAALNRADKLKNIPLHIVGVVGKGIGNKRSKVHRKEETPKYFVEDGRKKMHLTHHWRYKFFKQACDYLAMGMEMP
jgi:DNA-directed RNA polymerase beta' subunit